MMQGKLTKMGEFKRVGSLINEELEGTRAVNTDISARVPFSSLTLHELAQAFANDHRNECNTPPGCRSKHADGSWQRRWHYEHKIISSLTGY